MTRTRYLLKRVQTAEDRMEMAGVLVELAEKAEDNPMLRELLRKIQLPKPFDIMEYVKPYNRKGFWRRIPHWREFPTGAQLMAKLELSEIAYSSFGEKGTVERLDGTQINCVVHSIGEKMRGKRFVSEEERVEKERQKVRERISQAVESHK